MENITTQLLAALRNHLETHPIGFRGDADSMIDFLWYDAELCSSCNRNRRL